jgi:hypothetical protein
MTTISASLHTARKSYHCALCPWGIAEGEEYIRLFGGFERDPPHEAMLHLGCAQEIDDPKVRALVQLYWERPCPKCGLEQDALECWNCDGDGFSYHDCGEDTCACLDPEEKNVRCNECHGLGRWMICPHCNPEAFKDA